MKRSNLVKAVAVVGFGATVAFAGFSSTANAATATANLAVSATVTNNCTISTTALAFGSYDPVVANASANLDGTGTVVVACTKGATANIGLANGANFFAGARRMSNGGTEYLDVPSCIRRLPVRPCGPTSPVDGWRRALHLRRLLATSRSMDAWRQIRTSRPAATATRLSRQSTSERVAAPGAGAHMQRSSHLPLLVAIKVLRYQVAALVAASIIGGGPWAFDADAATFTVEPTQIVFAGRRTACS